MKQEVETPIVAANSDLSTNVSYGAADDLSLSEIVIPKILLIQKMSKMVDTVDARPGEFRDSVDGTLLGASDEGPELIFFKYFPTWITTRDKKYESTVPVTPENEGWPWEEFDGATVIRHNYTYNYYCLNAKENVAGSLPYVLSMSRMSARPAKRLNTVFMRMRRMQEPTWYKVFKLSSVRQENDQGVFYVFDFKQLRGSTAEEIQAAKYWAGKITTSAAIKVHEENDKQKKPSGGGAQTTFDDDAIPF